MPSQPIRKLNELQTSNMIKKTVTDASIRKKRIEDAVRDILHSFIEHILSLFIILYICSSGQLKSTTVLS